VIICEIILHLLVIVQNNKNKEVKFVPQHAAKTHMRVEVWIQSFLTLTLSGGEWLASRPHRIAPENPPPPLPTPIPIE
jgi:hypothetical protein